MPHNEIAYSTQEQGAFLLLGKNAGSYAPCLEVFVVWQQQEFAFFVRGSGCALFHAIRNSIRATFVLKKTLHKERKWTMKRAISAITSISFAKTGICDVSRRPLLRRLVGVLFLIVLSCGFMLAGCGGNKYEKALIGEWYEKGDDRRPAIVFLKDGTFEKEVYNVIREDWYTGVGDWSVEENQLILSSGSNAYVAEIISIEKESVVLRGIDFSWQSYAAIQSEPDNVLQLWKSP